MIRAIASAALALLCLAGSAAAQNTAPAAPPVQKEWTIMVFNNAKNNLEKLQIGAINAMEAVGSDGNVNIVVQLGKMQQFDDFPYPVFDGPQPLAKVKAAKKVRGSAAKSAEWTGSRRYCLVKDTDSQNITSPVLWEQPKVDMGDYKNVVDFAKWTAENFPARHYILLIANHGAGWLDELPKGRGISYDDETGNFIKTAELGPMLSEVSSALGQKLDVYYSAACLMQSVEVGYEMKDYVKVIVGAEEVAYTSSIAGFMWPMFFNQLMAQPGGTPEQQGAALAKAYAYGLKKKGYTGTLSAINAETLTQLGTDLTKWADLAMKLDDRAAGKAAKEKVKRFEYENYADLPNFLRLYAMNVSTMVPTEQLALVKDFRALTTKILASLKKEVIIQNAVVGTENKAAYGISVEVPILEKTSRKGWRNLPNSFVPYDKLAFSKATNWKAFCDYLDEL